MTFAFIACLVVVTAGFLILMDRKDKRAHEEREQDRRERADLMQRIQAPELAVVRHDVGEVPAELPQPPQTDEAYWEMSEEHAAAIAELTARENAIFDRV